MARSTLPAATRTARLIHLALGVTPVAFTAVVWLVIETRPMPPAGNPVIHFALVGLALLTMIAGALLAIQIPSRTSGQDEATYWQATLPRAIMVWGLFEAGGLLAAVAGLLSGTLLYPFIGLAAFLSLMAGFTPGRLAGS
jgi:hypothetical protein